MTEDRGITDCLSKGLAARRRSLLRGLSLVTGYPIAGHRLNRCSYNGLGRFDRGLSGAAMDLKGVRAFCSVAEGGSFSRAAAALGVAQSVLSRQVSALEGELGGRLFHRTGRGVQATELGQALLPRARPSPPPAS